MLGVCYKADGKLLEKVVDSGSVRKADEMVANEEMRGTASSHQHLKPQQMQG